MSLAWAEYVLGELMLPRFPTYVQYSQYTTAVQSVHLYIQYSTVISYQYSTVATGKSTEED